MDTITDKTTLLRDFIVAKGFSDQERLPPERDLAAQLGVTRGQLRAGLDQLESEGLLWRHVGKGTFYGPRPVTQPNVSSVSELTNPREIMEARLAIEPELARLAAHRASSVELSRLHDCIKHAEQSIDAKTFQNIDAQLHRTIAGAAGNSLLLALYESIHANRYGAIWGRLRDLLLTETQMKLYTQQHRDIVNAISERDSRNSCELMLRHLKSVEENIFQERSDYPGVLSDIRCL